jgi:predicted acyl esterase
MTTSPRRTLGVVLTVALLAAMQAASATSSTGWSPGPAKYGDTTVSDVSIPMDDGVNLVGDVMYPTDLSTGVRSNAKFPVLLTQNPYVCSTSQGNEGEESNIGGMNYYVDRGYIFASVCVRGAGRSGGKFDFFSPREQKDGVELVNWAAHNLPGSNGVVGLIGCSYLGLTQIFTAGVLPGNSPIKAMSPSCAGSELYRETGFSGGMPTETLEYDFPGVAGLIGARAGATGGQAAANVMTGGDHAYDGTFWHYRTPGDYAAHIVANKIPVLLWSGWDDIFTEGSEEMYAYLQNAWAGRPVYAPMTTTQRTSPRFQIVVGPWGHGGGIDAAMQLEWFDTWLKHENTPMRSTKTPMHLYQLGTNTWTNTASYPMATNYSRYYLGAGSLAPTPTSAKGGDTLAYVQPSAPEGSLSYTTKPFAHGATLAGPISATIYASSSGTNLNVIAALDDLAPDGTATRLTQGSLVASLRELDKSRSWYDGRGIDIRPYETFVGDQYLSAGQQVKLEIVISPRVASIAPGHSLRLVLTTQMDPTKCSALLGVHPCFPTEPQLQSLPGTYTILRGNGSQSAVNLPLLPYGFFKPTGGAGPEPGHL